MVNLHAGMIFMMMSKMWLKTPQKTSENTTLNSDKTLPIDHEYQTRKGQYHGTSLNTFKNHWCELSGNWATGLTEMEKNPIELLLFVYCYESVSDGRLLNVPS